MGAPKWIAKACTKMQGQFTSGTSSIAQRATKAAMEADPSCTEEMRKAFLARRDLVLAELAKMPGVVANVPEGAFYVFPDITSFFGKSDGETVVENAADLCMYLLMKGRVALVTGAAFGDPNCIRISYAASEDVLREAMRRVAEALAALK